jgi:predicted extracellular nuclease
VETKHYFIIFAGLILLFSFEKPKKKEIRVAFYNVENLFDTIDDPDVSDSEFTPESDKKWDSARYQTKLSDIANVVGELKDGVGPEIIGLCEIENRGVLEDLVKQPKLQKQKYKIVHFDSPDGRGIDVALLYKKGTVKEVSAKSIPIENQVFNRPTRDVLHFTALFSRKDTVHFFVTHFPSRYGGREASEPKRVIVAEVIRGKIDSLLALNKQSKIIVMGDFNDDPVDRSISGSLNAGPKPMQDQAQLYNPMYRLDTGDLGSYNYRDNWNMLDQIILSQGLLEGKGYKYQDQSAQVFGPDWLRQKEGRYAGYPDRTYAGSRYLGGVSDHFPVYIDLVR